MSHSVHVGQRWSFGKPLLLLRVVFLKSDFCNLFFGDEIFQHKVHVNFRFPALYIKYELRMNSLLGFEFPGLVKEIEA